MSIIEGEPVAAPASVSLEIGGKEITFETGKLAKQADGAVVIRSGDTMQNWVLTELDSGGASSDVRSTSRVS